MAGGWRPMRVEDLDAVAAISDSVHGAYTEAPPVYAERLRLYPAGCHVHLGTGAGDADRVTGYLVTHPWVRSHPPALGAMLGALPEAADTYYLHDIALLPAARGTGAGAAAVALVLDLARGAGFDDITLTAINGADRFWAAQGFAYVPPAETPAALAGYGDAARWMRRTL